MLLVRSLLTFSVTALLVISCAIFILAHWAAWRQYRRFPSEKPPEPPPGVSILKPVEGANETTYEAFASFCRIAYAGRIELLVGTIRPDDAITTVVDRLRKDYPECDIRLYFAELRGTNRKTSIMETLWQKAAGDYLFFSDADVLVAPDYLQQLLPLLTRPGVGCLTCLPRGIGAHTLGGKLIALHYDFNYLPQWMLAMRTTGIDWAIGHTMAVPREVLGGLGGFRDFLNHLADDYELGHRVTRLGLKVLVPPYLIDCFMPRESLRAAVRRLQRWKRTMRRARGPAFLGSILTYPVFWALLLAVLQPLYWWSWAALAGIVAIRYGLAFQLQTFVRLPGWKRSWWLLPLVDIIEGITFVGAYTGKTIYWAGRRYRLMPDGTLAAASENRHGSDL